MRLLLGAALLVAGCSDPTFSLRFRLTAGDSQQCISDEGDVTTSCENVTMLCDAYLSIRILNPEDPDAPYISMCEPLADRQPTLCAIAGPSLPTPDMPISEQTLEVQVAIFPSLAILTDPVTGAPVCPKVEYAANGLPMAAIHVCDELDPFACPRVPAVGGRAFYHPGDDKTVVDLGCTNLAELTNPMSCSNVNRIDATATVNDFDLPVSSVGDTVADRLDVGIGEPKPLGDTYELRPEDSSPLARTMAATPAWNSVVDLDLMSVGCIDVREDTAGTTSTLTCRNDVADKSRVEMTGYFLKKTTLAQIVASLGLPSFPDTGGLVVGLVVDENAAPLAGREVNCPGCTVQYINATRNGLTPGMTSSNGIFVSSNAPFGTQFSVQALPGDIIDLADAAGLGGVVEGKVTIVVLVYRETTIGEDPP